jgi:hypothetical protein
MIGLIYKDICIMKKSLIFNAVILLAVSLFFCFPWKQSLSEWSGAQENEIYVAVFLVVPLFVWFFAAILIGSVQEILFLHDENKCYSAFISSTPLTGNGQVLCKYYEMVMLSAVLLVWGAVCDQIICLVNGLSGSTLGMRMCFFFIQLFLRAVETPFMVRYGSKAGKQVKLLVLVGAAFLGIVYLLFGPLPDSDTLFETIGRWFLSEEKMSGLLLGAAAILPYAVLTLYYVSYRISCGLYQKGVETYDT